MELLLNGRGALFQSQSCAVRDRRRKSSVGLGLAEPGNPVARFPFPALPKQINAFEAL
jgi:hypothetical protein